LGIAVIYQGDVTRGMSLHEESSAIYRELDDEDGLAASLTILGYLALIQGEYEQATALNEQGLAL
jgi:hypothetical protein